MKSSKNKKKFLTAGKILFVLSYILLIICINTYDTYTLLKEYKTGSVATYIEFVYQGGEYDYSGTTFYIDGETDTDIYVIDTTLLDDANFDITSFEFGSRYEFAIAYEYTNFESGELYHYYMVSGAVDKSTGVNLVSQENFDENVIRERESSHTRTIVWLVLDSIVFLVAAGILIYYSNQTKQLKELKKDFKAYYLFDPTGASSLPFWKAKEPNNEYENVKVFREDEFKINKYYNFSISKYFKLSYDFSKEVIDYNNDLSVINISDFDNLAIANSINSTHTKMNVAPEFIDSLKQKEVYQKDFWLGIVNENGEIVASLIGEYDSEIKEGIIEWFQVLPSYQNKGYEKAIIGEFLKIARDRCDVITVRGNVNTSNKLMKICLDCGFDNCVYWYAIGKSTKTQV